jgi:hypothetical protein
VKLYQLLWQLLKHALHGRFRDEVFVSISLPDGIATGRATTFTWEDDQDAFCWVDAEAEGELLLHDEPVHLVGGEQP